MAGAGGQGLAIAQELCKDWTDSHGKTHPGIYDENDEHMQRWAETYPNAVTGCLHLVEPRKYRNDLFVAAKTLVPLGAIKFSPKCPKFDVLVLDDGTERKLGKTELNSLIQMDLMKEEIASVVRCKTPTGAVTYQLPPEKRNKMHDDRAYVFVLACWWLYQLRTDETFGDGVALDYSHFIHNSNGRSSSSSGDTDNPWLKFGGGNSHKVSSPFQGSSPFKSK